MSGGVNIKVTSQSRSDADVRSSLRLPRSMMPLSKMDPKLHSGGLPNPTLHYQHADRRRPSYSSSSVSPGPAELLRGAALKNHLLQQQKSSMFPHRSPASTERTDGTCSAYSSPQTPRREVPRSKDTLDLRATTLTQKAMRDLQLRRHANKNWTFGHSRLRDVDNTEVNDSSSYRLSGNVQQGQGRGNHLCTKGANGNEISGVSPAGMGSFQKDMRTISNQACEGHLSSDKSKSYHQTFNMPRRGSEPGKVNMAAVAPFRFRFQVHEDTDASLDNLSDCSSDSMEVCCDDLEKEGKKCGKKEEGGREGGRGSRRRGRGSREHREEGAWLRLPALSFCCCAVRRQEGVLKGGGVWKKLRQGEQGRRRERERLGSTATAAAAAACRKDGGKGGRGKKEKPAGLP
ncbi:unnamed protein product [Pleuronectes platessa]|uniref:Uncharacterized protein n=1 Tax=Pleuronectes platessa TaxID=8262 RepID=A0A9N7ZB89_PLEPL|nr:unnamed protein product [Pleuronectes platessa]